jgi:hypothetical protein
MRPLGERDLWHARYLLISDEDDCSTTSYYLALPELNPPYVLVIRSFTDSSMPAEQGRCSIPETEDWVVKGERIRALAEGKLIELRGVNDRKRQG